MVESASLTLRTLLLAVGWVGGASWAARMRCESERGSTRGVSQGVTLLMVSGSRWTLKRWLMVSAERFPVASSVDDDEARTDSEVGLMPANVSISLRIALIHASISCALSSTNRKLVAAVRGAVATTGFGVRSRESSEFLGPGSTAASWWA